MTSLVLPSFFFLDATLRASLARGPVLPASDVVRTSPLHSPPLFTPIANALSQTSAARGVARRFGGVALGGARAVRMCSALSLRGLLSFGHCAYNRRAVLRSTVVRAALALSLSRRLLYATVP